MKESEYRKLVLVWLEESFVEIEANPTLESRRRPDFIAYTPFNSYVIEVENTFEDVFIGIGQATYYASETGHTPVVVLPADNVEEPEFTYLRENDDTPLIETV